MSAIVLYLNSSKLAWPFIMTIHINFWNQRKTVSEDGVSSLLSWSASCPSVCIYALILRTHNVLTCALRVTWRKTHRIQVSHFAKLDTIHYCVYGDGSSVHTCWCALHTLHDLERRWVLAMQSIFIGPLQYLPPQVFIFGLSIAVLWDVADFTIDPQTFCVRQPLPRIQGYPPLCPCISW